MLIRDTKSSRGFVIESPAQMTRLHNILGVITFHIFSILFLRCWHQTFQHFFNWKLNKDGFGLFRDSLGRSRFSCCCAKGPPQRWCDPAAWLRSLFGAKLAFQTFSFVPSYQKSMTSMGTFGL